jgi:hypothetical protein
MFKISGLPKGHVLCLCLSCALVGAVAASPSSAQAGELTFRWTANSEKDIAGYRLYYGDSPTPPYNGSFAAQGPSPVQLPMTSLEDPQKPTVKLSGLPACHKLFFAVTAYNKKGLESDFSNSVNRTVTATPMLVEAVPVDAGTLRVTWSGIAAEDLKRLNRIKVHYGPNPGEPYQGTGANQGDSPVLVNPTSNTMFLTGLGLGQQVFLAVEAVCPNGAGKLSKEVAAITNETQSEMPRVLQGGCSLAAGAGRVSRGGAVLLLLALLGLLARRRR